MLFFVYFQNRIQALERFDVFRDIQPSYVVLYDADIAVIRGIEAYQSTLSRGEKPVKVYFLMYGTCAESRTYIHNRVDVLSNICMITSWYRLSLSHAHTISPSNRHTHTHTHTHTHKHAHTHTHTFTHRW